MANSPQKDIEDILIALIQTQSPFDTSPVKELVLNQDVSANTVSIPDRVIVQAGIHTPAANKRSTLAAVTLFKAPVKITIRLSNDDPAKLDAWWVATETALGTTPAGIVTQATGLFPGWFAWESFDGGSREGDGVNQRERNMSFVVRFKR